MRNEIWLGQTDVNFPEFPGIQLTRLHRENFVTRELWRPDRVPGHSALGSSSLGRRCIRVSSTTIHPETSELITWTCTTFDPTRSSCSTASKSSINFLWKMRVAHPINQLTLLSASLWKGPTVTSSRNEKLVTIELVDTGTVRHPQAWTSSQWLLWQRNN